MKGYDEYADEYINFLEKEYIINHIKIERCNIFFSFENTVKKVSALSDCCDDNWFENLEDINTLLGCKIISIEEGSSIIEGQVENSYDYRLSFPIKIKYEKELREKSIDWSQIPKDIFNMLYSLITDEVSSPSKEREFNFTRKNESNGYYEGYLDINLIDGDY